MSSEQRTDRFDRGQLDSIHDRVLDRLRARDQRYTTRRRLLVAALAVAGRPLTLPELLAIEPDLPQSSAYRNLELLERMGLVRRITHGPDHARYELAEPLLDHHHHLICVDCGRVEDVKLDDSVERAVEQALGSAAEAAGYRALHHSLDLHGHCAGCGPAS